MGQLSNYPEFSENDPMYLYMKIRKAQNMSEVTIENEYNAHRLLWRFLKKNDPLKVTKEDIELYSLYLIDYGYAPNTCHNKLKFLRGFYKEALIQEWTLVDPTAQIKLPKRSEPLPTVLSVVQIKKILAAPNLKSYKGIRDRALMELMYSSGLRRAEAAAVKATQFTNDFRTIRLKGKGNKEAVIPVGRMAAHFCKYCSQYSVDDNIFISTTKGVAIKKSTVSRVIKEYAQKVGIKTEISAHTFRYSVATHLSDHGADIRHIQEFLRHDSINTTAGYIRHGIASLQKIHNKTHPRG